MFRPGFVGAARYALVTKKRSDERQAPAPAKRTTTKSSKTEAAPKKRAAPRAVETAVAAASKKAARPKLRASYAEGKRVTATKTPTTTRRPTIARAKGPGLARGPAVRKAPLATPKREKPRKAAPETPSAARQLALDIVAGGLEKKALNCEVIDVRGRVDYADFLVIMTGRSDRHVASIAHGVQEELSKKKITPISVEGMTSSTWILIDYADVVVHVFQEDARQLYDIEGLWMDAGRVAVANEPGQTRPAVAAPAEDADAEDEDEVDEDEAVDADEDDADDDEEDEDVDEEDDDESDGD